MVVVVVILKVISPPFIVKLKVSGQLFPHSKASRDAQPSLFFNGKFLKFFLFIGRVVLTLRKTTSCLFTDMDANDGTVAGRVPLQY